MSKINIFSLVATMGILLNLILGIFGIFTYNIIAVYAIAICGWISILIGEFK